jgi:hypothetical protein
MFGSRTDPLIVHYGNFFNPTEPTEFFVQVAFLSADTESEDSQHIRGIGCLLGLVSIAGGNEAVLYLTHNWGMRRPPRTRGGRSATIWASIASPRIATSSGAARTRTAPWSVPFSSIHRYRRRWWRRISIGIRVNRRRGC